MKYFIGMLLLVMPLFSSEVSESTLKNGMKVVLKPSHTGEEEVLIQLIAKGGFASLPTDKQVSGRVASDIVWEVGLDGLTSEQISAKLYEASSDLQASIQPLYRKIEGSCWKDSTKIPLEMIRLMFTEPKLSESDLKKGLVWLKHGFKADSSDVEMNLDIQSKLLNSDNWPPFLPLTAQDLNRVDLDVVRSFYKRSFSNPAEFLCVIVGDFDRTTLLHEISETLEKIPPSYTTFFASPTFPPFPQGIRKLTLVQRGRTTSFCRFTFPVLQKIDVDTFSQLEACARILEVHLRTHIKNDKKQTMGLDVSYELPFYPFLDAAWLTIHFFAPADKIESFAAQVLQEFKVILEEGPSEIELDTASRQIVWTDEYWQQDDAYWLLRLSNTYLWNWDPKLLQKSDKPATFSPSEAKKMIQSFLSLDNYTRIITHP